MALVFVRIEMHKATPENYTHLHAAMEAGGYSRRVVDGTGITFQLPTAMYAIETSWTASQVRDHSQQIADGVDPGSWVLVVQSADWACRLVKTS